MLASESAESSGDEGSWMIEGEFDVEAGNAAMSDVRVRDRKGRRRSSIADQRGEPVVIK